MGGSRAANLRREVETGRVRKMSPIQRMVFFGSQYGGFRDHPDLARAAGIREHRWKMLMSGHLLFVHEEPGKESDVEAVLRGINGALKGLLDRKPEKRRQIEDELIEIFSALRRGHLERQLGNLERRLEMIQEARRLRDGSGDLEELSRESPRDVLERRGSLEEWREAASRANLREVSPGHWRDPAWPQGVTTEEPGVDAEGRCVPREEG